MAKQTKNAKRWAKSKARIAAAAAAADAAAAASANTAAVAVAADAPANANDANDTNANTNDHPPPAASASNFDSHNDLCERCGFGGEVVCCGNCNLVFHCNCTQPKLNSVPNEEENWRCVFCISEDVNVPEEERRLAKLHKCEIELEKNEVQKRRGTATDESASKRLRSGSSTADSPTPTSRDDTDTHTSREMEAIPDENDATAEFVESFFGKAIPTQKQLLNAILTDQRVRDVMPAYFTQDSSEASLRYNNEMVDLGQPEKYRPIDNTAFHYHTPGINGGRHRSLDDKNNVRANFNVTSASNKSSLHYANKIKNFVMSLNLTVEQRRYSLWKSFSLPGMRTMVESYGFNSISMNVGMLIASNVQNFMKYSRTTNHRYGRVTDAQRIAVNAIATSAMQTPPRRSPGGSKIRNQSYVNKVSDRAVLKFLGLPLGSSHILRKCGDLRRAAKDGLDTAYDFLGPRKNWKKVSDDVWERFRHEWLPSCHYITDVPSKKETVFLRNVEGEYFIMSAISHLLFGNQIPSLIWILI